MSHRRPTAVSFLPAKRSLQARLRPGYLAMAAAMCLPVAGAPARADSLLVGNGGNGGISTGDTMAGGSGGGGGIGGGGAGGGSGYSGGAGGGVFRGNDGLTGAGIRGADNGGPDGGAGGASGTLGGQFGVGGGGGAAGSFGSTGGGGSGGGGLGAGGGLGNGGAGGDGGSIVDVSGTPFSGTASQGAQAVPMAIIGGGASTFDYVGVGGGGGGGGKGAAGGAGSAGDLTLDSASWTVNRSLLVGGGGGGSSTGGAGGRGGDGVLTLAGSVLSVADTLQVGGAGGGSNSSDLAGGQGGNGTLTVGPGSSLLLGNGARLVVGGGAGGGNGVLNLVGMGLADFGGTGSFIINANGTLNIGGSPTGSVTGGTIDNLDVLVNHGTINFNQTGIGEYGLASAITGSGSVTVNAPGTTTFTGANSYTGGTSVLRGTLQIGAGGNSGAITGDILNNAMVVFNRADTLTYSGSMTGAGQLTQLGLGTLKLTGASSGTGAILAAHGTLELTGAGAALGSTTSGTYVGTLGSASVVVSAGATMKSDDVIVGYSGYSYGSTATVTGPGSSWSANYVTVGSGGVGTLQVLDGGLLSSTRGLVGLYRAGSALVSGADSQWTSSTGVILGSGSGYTGALTVEKGGTVRTPQVEINNGSVNVTGSDALGRGTLAANAIVRIAGAPIATVNFDGGQVQAGAPEADFFQGFGPSDLTLGAGGLYFDTGIHAVGISAPLNGAGGLNKLGSGTLTLAGANTYAGATRVDAGSLVVNGSIANSAVTVGNGARLSGSGTVGATTVAAGGVLAPGDTLGSLRVAGGFNLTSGATLEYELGAPGTGAASPGISDHLQVDGNVTLDGSLSLSDPGMAAGVGYYRLISYGGSLSMGGLRLDVLPPTLSAIDVRVVAEVAGHVDLRVGAAGSNLLQTWAGGNGTWNASNANWLDDGGSLPQVWAGNHAVFLTPGGGTVGVQGTQSFAGLQFVADGYRLDGAGVLETRPGGSELRVLGGATATIATAITGVGGIDKTQGGTLVLDGANTYAGGTTVSGGVLSVSADTNLGAAASGVTLNGGTLRIANAAYQGTSRGLALGAAGGALDLPNDFTLQGAISGTGALNKTGTGALTLASDSGGYAGTATVSAGSLALADGARLGGSLQVASGALLGGTGTLASATFAPGAVHAPGGDGIGTQTFTGDYANHGTLRIDATPAAHDSVVVAGGVDITGATLDLRLTPADASAWTATTGPYTLISKQSAGAVAGGFAAVNNPLLFLAATVDTAGGDGNDVTLTLSRNERSLASVAQTPNQRAVANAIESLPQTHEVWRNTMLSNDAFQLQQGMNLLSGDVYASAVSSLLDAPPMTSQMALANLRNNLAAAQLPGAPSAQAGVSDAPVSAALLPRAGDAPLWAQVTGNWQRQRGDANAPGADQSSTGVVLGGDVGVGQGWRLGGAFGYTDARLRPDQRAASVKTQSYTAAVYGGKAYAAGADTVNVMAGAAYSWHDIDTRRQLRYGSMDQTLTAGYSGSTTQLFAEVGYAMAVAPAVTLEPFIGVSWSDLRVRGFSESGGSAAVSGSSQNQDTTSTLAGLRGQWAPTNTDIALRGMLGWRHAYGSLRPTQTLAFDQGSSFSVTGAPIARDAARVELGADLVVVRNMTAGLSYAGEFGSGNRQHAGSLDVRWRF